ncbi:hypothetical protein BIV57_13050 [Mangrovactinospora gilvigrisea]|uniref:MHYT domain-containing protein n=2 Tax=Mangrovactinospora gilvigrisea TaxID=1428644 RepID=A0A1J7C6C0_9ACTN|nr:hypothetical protein BIV57_13050 [Mangrovactinospora gilvigrisea]
MTRARAVGRSSVGWLSLAAVAIGGTGIWVMHFIAMLGFSISGRRIAFNLPLTLLSAVIGMVFVGLGLAIVLRGGRRVLPLATAGVLTGLGVAAMHYTGMYAMDMQAHLSYDPLLFGASVVIAVVASTAALWFTLSVHRWYTVLSATVVMGVAVTGMHYVGMYALRVKLVGDGTAAVGGISADSILLPLILGVCLVSVVLLFIIALSPGEEELEDIARHQARLAESASAYGSASAPASAYDQPAPPAAQPDQGLSAGFAHGPVAPAPTGEESVFRPRIDPDTGRATRPGRAARSGRSGRGSRVARNR